MRRNTPTILPRTSTSLGIEGLHGVVLGDQPDAAVDMVEPLDGGLGAVDQRGDDLTLGAVVLAADDDVVAVEDAGQRHRLAADAEQEALAGRGEDARDGHLLLDVLLGQDRRAGGDGAEQRQHPDVVVDRCAVDWRSRRSIARGLVGSRFSAPRDSSACRCACTVDDEVRPTASPISRTVGG